MSRAISHVIFYVPINGKIKNKAKVGINDMGVGKSRTLGVQGAGVLGVILPHMNEENIETDWNHHVSVYPSYQCLSMDEVF